MKDFFEHFGDRVSNFMKGHYGTDDFSKFLLVVTLVLYVMSLIFRSGWIFWLAVIALVWSWYRMLSDNFAKRESENRRYLAFSAKLKKFLKKQKEHFDGRKDYRYFKCPGCGQEVRVPKGKGHIRITCPKCHTQFDRTV
jgi:hypothetical protein